MKKIIFEVRYYLLFLILTLSLFLALIFNPVSSSNVDDTDFGNKEVTRGSIQINEIALLNENEEQTSNRTQIIYVEKNNTLIELLDEAGLSNKYIRALIKAKGSEKLANLKTGDKLEVEINRDQIPKNIFLSSDGLNGINASFNNGLFSIYKVSRQPDVLERFASVEIEDSLYQSALEADIPDSVIMDLVYIFGWDIDFIFDIRPGDSFDLLYEEYFLKGNKVKNGDIKAARFKRGKKVYTAVRYFLENDQKEFFSIRGKNVEKAFLRSPVEFSYISSKYNLKRKHPILNKIKAHTGVDYAAPTGTPVRTTGDGTISFRGNNGGYGKLIEIKHSEDYSTRYAHLSRYKKDLKVGDKVSQGEIIGYVGRTGRATGPHLHYEFRVNGMHTNPLTVKLPAAKPINEKEKDSFFKTAIEAMNKMDDYYLKLYAESN
ncbi:M23 family metallopeptidase [SAR86 cluster bacterium]|jgi:murein DD-endopeptidase MepM/ murein hydrolase activator NlpD|nr:M23 family metallopeptidase [SAR86 cluster bacterium]